MDREQFDAIARLVWTKQTRRAALGGLLGAVALGPWPEWAAGKPKPKDKTQRRRQRKKRKQRKQGNDQRQRRACYRGSHCIPGPGRDMAGCDFANSTHFFQGDFGGANLSHANLTGAQMAGANLQGADLGGACLVGANLLEADLAGADLDGAIVCQTLMPDGSINDSGCGQGTHCCPTICEEQRGEECVGGCINTLNQVCSIFGEKCCSPLVCAASISVAVTSCQQPCDSDADCTIFPNATKCCTNGLLCPFMKKCCQEPHSPAGCGQ